MEKKQDQARSDRQTATNTQPDPRRKLRYREVLLETLERIGCGGVILDSNGDLIAINSVATEILKHRGSPETGRQVLNTICLPHPEDDWVSSWQDTGHPLAIVRIPTEQDIVLMLVDVGTNLQPSAQVLRRMFGLTPAESKVALGLASGFSLDDVAHKHGVRKTTVRTQLASVFAKTHASCQAGLIALLARLAILP